MRFCYLRHELLGAYLAKSLRIPTPHAFGVVLYQALACGVQPPQCIQFPSPHAFGVLLYQARASGVHPPQCIQCSQRATPHACVVVACRRDTHSPVHLECICFIFLHVDFPPPPPGILRIADPMATEHLMIAVPHARRAVSRRMFFRLPSRDLTLRQPYRDPEGFAISGTSCWVLI